MRKLMWFTIGFTVAVALGTYLFTPNVYLYASGGVALLLSASLALMLRFPKVRIAAMVLFGCVLGFLCQLGYETFYLSTARAADGQEMTAIIYATDYSYATDYGAAVEGRVALNGKQYSVRTYLPKETILSPGDSVYGEFRLRCTLPGCSKESDYYRSGGTFLIAYSEEEIATHIADVIPWYGYSSYIRQNITLRIDGLFPPDTAAFAKALLLGDTSDIDYETDTAFKLSGIRHVIAVSGMHVTILFSLVYIFTARKRWLTAMIGIPVLFFFAAVAGFSPSIVRACIMHALIVVATLFERDYDPPSALSFAVLLMLLINPWTVTNVGFQLSVGCMVGIFLFSQKIQNWLLDKSRLGCFKGFLGKLFNWFAVTVAITISASIVTTPLSAGYFGTVSLISPLTNLLTLWVITYIFYGIMMACVASLVFFPLGSCVAWAVSWGIRYVLFIAKSLAAFPLSAVYTQSLYIILWLVLCYTLLAAFMLMKNKQPLLLGCCATIGLCIALTASWTEPLQDECRVTVMDVGQGQCILLQSQGRNFLVDCGGDSDTAAADIAAATLLSQGISRLDGLIITHYDRDHAAGAAYLLQRIGADCLYLPTCLDEDGTAEALRAYKGGQVLLIKSDVALTFGEAKITLIPSQTAISDNESGLCVLFQTKNCDILITGDRTAKGELELIQHMTLPELEVLIVGHHGSKTSTCRELLIKTSPQIAIISVGIDNSYGHPTEEVLDRLAQYGCVVYRTDLNGTVIYRG